MNIYKTRPIFLVIFIVVTTSIPFRYISAELLNPQTDLVYLGAFRLPSDTAGSIYGWSYGLNALTFYPDGDPNGPQDGFPGSLYASNNTNEYYVAEISIPPPIVSKNVEDLNRASTLQNFHDITGDLYSKQYMEMDIEYLPKQGQQTTDKLHIAWNNWYNVSDSDVDRYGWCELGLTNPNTQGTWGLGSGNSEVNIGDVGEFLFEIPASWAAEYISGKRLLVGKYREGGCSDGGNRYGGGPGMHAYAPWEQGNPPPPGTALQQVTLLSYAGGHVWHCAANGDTCKVKDKWEGGAWVTVGNKSAVILTGRKGLGEDYYGISPNGCEGKGYHNLGGYKPYMLFYNPDDLAAVARGEKQPFEPQPYATLDCGQYAFRAFDLCNAGFSSAAYDRAHELLYVAEPFADGDKPVIHVFRVVNKMFLFHGCTISGGISTQ